MGRKPSFDSSVSPRHNCKCWFNHPWVLPISNQRDLIELRHKVVLTQVYSSDQIMWDGYHASLISLGTIWNSIRSRGTTPLWAGLVWHSLSISKCSFIVWLAFKNRLLTKDRMIKFGINVNPICVLCGIEEETVQHIFFSCNFISTIYSFCPFQFAQNWTDLLNGRICCNERSSWRLKLGALYFKIVVYLVWLERNHRIHHSLGYSDAVSTFARVKVMCKEKIFSCDKFRKQALKDPTLALLVV